MAHRKRDGQQNSQQRPEQGENRQGKETEGGQTESDRHDRSDGRAARHADDSGVRQRISENPLQHRAGNPQPGADHQSDGRPRQPDMP